MNEASFGTEVVWEWDMEGLEAEHVHKVYSQIAEHFSDTRFKPWPRIAQFLMEQPPGSLIADVGEDIKTNGYLFDHYMIQHRNK